MADGTPVTKQSIRRVLAIISRLYPLARPTRGLLKQVFNFFEPPRNVAAAAAAANMQSMPDLTISQAQDCKADDSAAVADQSAA